MVVLETFHNVVQSDLNYLYDGTPIGSVCGPFIPFATGDTQGTPSFSLLLEALTVSESSTDGGSAGPTSVEQEI